MRDGSLTTSSWETEGFDIPAYLERIGVEAGPPDHTLLERLHDAHVQGLYFKWM